MPDFVQLSTFYMHIGNHNEEVCCSQRFCQQMWFSSIIVVLDLQCGPSVGLVALQWAWWFWDPIWRCKKIVWKCWKGDLMIPTPIRSYKVCFGINYSNCKYKWTGAVEQLEMDRLYLPKAQTKRAKSMVVHFAWTTLAVQLTNDLWSWPQEMADKYTIAQFTMVLYSSYTQNANIVQSWSSLTSCRMEKNNY